MNRKSLAGPQAEPTARRHPLKTIAVWFVGLVAVAVITVGVMSERESAPPNTPKPATVDTGSPPDGPVVPFSVDDSTIIDAFNSRRLVPAGHPLQITLRLALPNECERP